MKLPEKERIAIIKKFLKDQKNSSEMKKTKEDYFFGQGRDKMFRYNYNYFKQDYYFTNSDLDMITLCNDYSGYFDL